MLKIKYDIIIMTSDVYYNINKILKNKVTNIRREFYNVKKVNICVYKINTSNENNFLEYLCYKDETEDLLYFPRFTYNVEELKKNKNFEKFENKCVKEGFSQIVDILIEACADSSEIENGKNKIRDRDRGRCDTIEML